MKIAIPTDDGVTISRHFGQAANFKVVTVENGSLTSHEIRAKASHQHGDHGHEGGMHPGQMMVDSIADCQVLIAGGMGSPVYDRATQAGIRVLMTRQVSIETAVASFLAGTLENEPGLIHGH